MNGYQAGTGRTHERSTHPLGTITPALLFSSPILGIFAGIDESFWGEEGLSGVRQGHPGGGQHQPDQVSLGVEAQLAVEMFDVSAHRRLGPVRGHGNIPDAVAGGQGGSYTALGLG